MNFREYQVRAARTMNTALTRQERLANGALGLAGEVAEVAPAILAMEVGSDAYPAAHKETLKTIRAELGDVLWYVAAIATAADLDMTDFEAVPTAYAKALPRLEVTPAVCLLRLLDAAGRVTERVKKALYHGKPLDTGRLRADLCAVLGGVEALGLLTKALDGRKKQPVLRPLMEENIAKLEARYPEGFSAPSLSAQGESAPADADRVDDCAPPTEAQLRLARMRRYVAVYDCADNAQWAAACLDLYSSGQSSEKPWPPPVELARGVHAVSFHADPNDAALPLLLALGPGMQGFSEEYPLHALTADGPDLVGAVLRTYAEYAPVYGRGIGSKPGAAPVQTGTLGRSSLAGAATALSGGRLGRTSDAHAEPGLMRGEVRGRAAAPTGDPTPYASPVRMMAICADARAFRWLLAALTLYGGEGNPYVNVEALDTINAVAFNAPDLSDNSGIGKLLAVARAQGEITAMAPINETEYSTQGDA